MDQMLHVSSNPHVRDKMSTSRIMQLVVIALLPASVFGIWNFGFRALLIILVSVVSSVAFEWLYDHFMHKQNTITDYSAVVTGLLLALNMPASIPLWMPVLGSAFAIIVVKQLFGGLGQNIMNPALAGRCFLMISFAGKMTDFAVSDGFRGVVDSVTGATPLAALKDHGFTDGSVPVWDMFLGNTQGTIGETSALAILIGAVILLIFKVIDLKVPLTYIGSFSVFVILYMLFSGMGFDGNYLFSHLFGGGLMLGAWFMATDYVTTPITVKGQLVYGCCLGVLTAVFRLFGGSAEGVSYAIIFCNLLVPLIERVTRPIAFGKGGKKA
ncbi:RnfABCDGE type electron transport complex subunit D [Blautia schinkii]|nr:RnfABCDGE type electron transport complex subunit D [Blautia schinkii]